MENRRHTLPSIACLLSRAGDPLNDDLVKVEPFGYEPPKSATLPGYSEFGPADASEGRWTPITPRRSVDQTPSYPTPDSRISPEIDDMLQSSETSGEMGTLYFHVQEKFAKTPHPTDEEREDHETVSKRLPDDPESLNLFQIHNGVKSFQIQHHKRGTKHHLRFSQEEIECLGLTGEITPDQASLMQLSQIDNGVIPVDQPGKRPTKRARKSISPSPPTDNIELTPTIVEYYPKGIPNARSRQTTKQGPAAAQRKEIRYVKWDRTSNKGTAPLKREPRGPNACAICIAYHKKVSPSFYPHKY